MTLECQNDYFLIDTSESEKCSDFWVLSWLISWKNISENVFSE